MKNCFAIRAFVILSAVLVPQASSADTEGTYSTFYGLGAGAANSGDANSNTFVGSYAGYNANAAPGGYNTFLGSLAGFSDTTGAFNVFIGRETGYHTTTGSQNTFVGTDAGYVNDTGYDNTFVGYDAGHGSTNSFQNSFFGHGAGFSIDSGVQNTFLGASAGFYDSSGSYNTFLGASAGLNSYGDSNIMIGANAGRNESSASNRLYIDNCYSGLPCSSPLIYGEFDSHRLRFNGMTEVHYDGAPKSQMNFSQSSTDTGGYLTSVLDNNFFVSSGARYDSGNWVQRSADTNAVMAGSGGVGYRIFTHTGTAVGNTFNNPTLRLHIDYSGQFGINTAPVGGDEIHTSSGAHLTSGGVWTDASSREYKENVKPLTTEQAMQAVAQLVPVTYNYKADRDEKHVGFIAEDVPDLVATKDRRSLSPMDIVAVLTKVVRKQVQDLEDKTTAMQAQQKVLEGFEAKLVALEAEMQRLREQQR